MHFEHRFLNCCSTLALLGVLIILTPVMVSSQALEGFYQEMQSMPGPRTGHEVHVYDDQLLVFVGLTQGFNPGDVDEIYCYQDIWSYDLTNDVWQTVGQTSFVGWAMYSATVGGSLYLAGGETPSKWPNRRNIEVNLSDFDETLRADIPEQLNGWIAFADAGRFHILGGHNGYGPNDANYVYDPSTDGWTVGQSVPSGLERSGFAIVDSLVYIFGGRGYGGYPSSNALLIYNMNEDSFESGATLPLPLKDAACARIGENIYVFGGYTGDVSPTDGALIYNIATDSWSTAPDLPYAVVDAVARSVSGHIFIVGGHYWNGSTLSVYDKLLRYVPAPTAALSLDTIYAPMANAIDAVELEVRIGGPFDGYTTSDIDISTLFVNDSLPLLADNLDEVADSLIFTVSLSDFVAGYGVQWGTTVQSFAVSAQFTDGQPFEIPGSFIFRGHIAGDLNLDGSVNVSDVTLLTGVLFAGQETEDGFTLDIDGDCHTNVVDLTYLVAHLFAGGPAPLGGC